MLCRMRMRNPWGSLLPLSLVLSVSACGPSSVHATGQPTASPCSSPYADSTSDHYVAVPTSGGEVRVDVKVGEHLVVGWKSCGSAGDIRLMTGPLTVTDASSTGKGGPAVDVRFLATGVGEARISGDGSAGRGDIIVSVHD